MPSEMTHGDWLAAFIGEELVIEASEGFTVFGTLAAIGPAHIELREADLHSQLEANSTRDVYALETKQLGIRPNRSRLFLPRERIIALARLEDIQP
jgi:hypothetical protein